MVVNRFSDSEIACGYHRAPRPRNWGSISSSRSSFIPLSIISNVTTMCTRKFHSLIKRLQYSFLRLSLLRNLYVKVQYGVHETKRKTLINKILIEGLQRFFFVSFFFFYVFFYMEYEMYNSRISNLIVDEEDFKGRFLTDQLNLRHETLSRNGLAMDVNHRRK